MNLWQRIKWHNGLHKQKTLDLNASEWGIALGLGATQMGLLTIVAGMVFLGLNKGFVAFHNLSYIYLLLSCSIGVLLGLYTTFIEVIGKSSTLTINFRRKFELIKLFVLSPLDALALALALDFLYGYSGNQAYFSSNWVLLGLSAMVGDAIGGYFKNRSELRKEAQSLQESPVVSVDRTPSR